MKIAVLGAGQMGRAALFDLTRSSDVTKTGVYDIDEHTAAEVAQKYGNEQSVSGRLDVSDREAVTKVLEDYDAALSCVSYKYNAELTAAAIAARCHLTDLGGNNDVVREQLAMNDEAEQAGVIVIPDCGLAPGMVSILAADGVNRLDKVRSLKIRVGGLPQVPRPPLNYQIAFSSEGLINEYWEPVVVLRDGRKQTVNPMTGLESLEFDGIGELEAFYTSGGVSTLPETYAGKIDDLDYKTIRYPGHCEKVRPMLEVGLASRQPVEVNGYKVVPRSLFKAVLEKSMPFKTPDLALVRLTIEGTLEGQDKKLVYEIVDRQDSRTGLTAMMRLTAFPAAIVTWMAAAGQITARGVKPQEVCVSPQLFIPQLKKRNIRLTIKELD